MTDQSRDQRFPTKLVGSVVLIALLVIFWAQNRGRVKVTYYGFHSTTRIWVALVISAAIGFLLGVVVARRGRD